MNCYSDDNDQNELVCLKAQEALEIMNEINFDVWLIPTQGMGDGFYPINPLMYSDNDLDDFAWIFDVSKSVPPTHLEGGYKGAIGNSQDRNIFPLGCSAISSVCKDGDIIWSRVFHTVDGNNHIEIGSDSANKLLEEETTRKLKLTNEE